MTNVKVQLASWTKHKTTMNSSAIIWSMNLAFMDETFYFWMTFIHLLSMMMHIVVNYLWNTLPSWMRRQSACVYKIFPPFVSCFISCSKPFLTSLILWKVRAHVYGIVMKSNPTLWYYVYMYLCMSSSIIWSSTSLITYTRKCLSHNAFFLLIFLVFVHKINSVFQLFGHQICGCFLSSKFILCSFSFLLIRNSKEFLVNVL